jgi:hypothetical protein
MRLMSQGSIRASAANWSNHCLLVVGIGIARLPRLFIPAGNRSMADRWMQAGPIFSRIAAERFAHGSVGGLAKMRD